MRCVFSVYTDLQLKIIEGQMLFGQPMDIDGVKLKNMPV